MIRWAVICILALSCWNICRWTFADGEVPILQSWEGQCKDESLQIRAPETSFLVNPVDFERLWTAWNPDRDPPKIDFANEVILVGTVPGPNRIMMRPTFRQAGNLEVIAAGTRRGGPGFSWKLLKIQRSDALLVNSQPVSRPCVQGHLYVEASANSFKGASVEVKLWSYDPRLADRDAELVDELVVSDYHHQTGMTTRTRFILAKDLTPLSNRRYYLTAFVLKDGTRTHIGELEGMPGLCEVLSEGKPTVLAMRFRQLP